MLKKNLIDRLSKLGMQYSIALCILIDTHQTNLYYRALCIHVLEAAAAQLEWWAGRTKYLLT